MFTSTDNAYSALTDYRLPAKCVCVPRYFVKSKISIVCLQLLLEDITDLIGRVKVETV